MKIITLILICFLFASCLITNTPGFYSGYSRLPENERQKVIFTTTGENISSMTDTSKIYAVNGQQIFESLRFSGKALVYIWSPHCHGANCHSLNLVQNYCNNNSYTLYVIAEYYDFPAISEQRHLSFDGPIFTISEKYYKTKYCNKYFKKFMEDLLYNQSYNKNDIYNNFFIFEHGILKATSIEL